mmetsp:Transcript_4096/g.10325  ORF Transcript_4096/g.10325 Transcript_4096/m.10325 type:complete len:400 (+) Transcript_4096:3-1202(+)
MAGSPRRVEQFLGEVASEVLASYGYELSTLNASSDVDVYKPYNYGYAMNRYVSEMYDVNETLVKSFFTTQGTRDGILEVARQLFDVQMVAVAGVPVWHADVQAYDIMVPASASAANRRLIGRAYLDLHPRAGKFKHAAMFPIRQGLDGNQLPEAAVVTNFPRGPEHMSFSDVQTFFHEFGHLLHHVLGGQNQSWVAFSGIATAWDFVEAPSQLLEHWPQSAETLEHFAVNDRGETIPAELVAALKAASAFGRATATQQQLFYAFSALRLHQLADPLSVDLEAFERNMSALYSPFDKVDDTHAMAAFGHLNGYGPLYYTYQWSLAIADDLFYSRFCPGKMYDIDVSHQYERDILRPGGKEDASAMVENFLGRAWTADAYTSVLRGGGSSCARHFTTGHYV